LIPDASIARGGCRVDSDIASVDGTLAARWRRASAALGSDTAWTNAEPDVPPDAHTGEAPQ
jgi:flagellar assembly protein FliH